MKLIELCDEILGTYENPVLLRVVELNCLKIARACKLMYYSLEAARDNIGVPQLDYPARISYSWTVIVDALSEVDKLMEEK